MARDYKAEYRRRIARGSAAGLSRSQARGHARSGERTIKPMSDHDTARLRRATRHFIKHGSITGAAKIAGVSTERLRRQLYEQRIAQRKGRRVQRHIREMKVISRGRERTIEVGFDAASQVGAYRNAVRQFLETTDLSLLAPFENKFVTDLSGKRHLFETDPNTLFEISFSSSGTFEQVYRLTTI